MAAEEGSPMIMEMPKTFGRKRGCKISGRGAILLASLFLLSMVATGLLVYYLRPCERAPGVIPKSENQSVPEPPPGPTPTIEPRLSTSVVPDSYDIKLMPFIWPGNFTFNGEVKILVNVTMDTNNITLHAADLKILPETTKVEPLTTTSNQNHNVSIADQFNDTAREFYIIKTVETLKADTQYEITMRFIGSLNDELRGFYRSSYTVGNETRWIATTHFHPTSARRAFPCFDEPALQAKFQVTIVRPTNMTSVSNMPRNGNSTTTKDLPGYELDQYLQSTPTSTNLLAFVISDFVPSTTGSLTIWTRPEAQNQTEFARKIHNSYSKEYHDQSALPPLAIVAIPDSPDDVSNVDSLIYPETVILFQDGVSTTLTKKRIASTVTQKLLHQFFNTLTPPSPSATWLSAGFATYLEYIVMNQIEKDVLEEFIVDRLQSALAEDASRLITIENGHSNAMDQVSRNKAASIIRMMQRFLDRGVFQRAMTDYLKTKSYNSTEETAFWEELRRQDSLPTFQSALPQNVTLEAILDTWTHQPGYPVLTVRRNFSSGEVLLTQDRFTYHNSTVAPAADALWWIPVSYTTYSSAVRDFRKPSVDWMDPTKSMTRHNLTIASEWLVFNIREAGYYRVNYDTKSWNMIIQQLSSELYVIDATNRAQLVDDALNLARAGRLEYEVALNLTSYLRYDREYLPWKPALTAMVYLDDMLSTSAVYEQFRNFIDDLLISVYETLEFEGKADRARTVYLARTDVLTWACKVNHKTCVANATQYFDAWRTAFINHSTYTIPPNLRSLVYCTAARTGGQAVWDFMWERYLDANVAEEKELLLAGLSCSSEDWILRRLLNRATTEGSGIRKRDTVKVFEAVADNPTGGSLVFQVLRSSSAKLMKYVGMSYSAMERIIKGATKRFRTQSDLANLRQFATEAGDEFRSVIQECIEQTEVNMQWFDRSYQQLVKWFSENRKQPTGATGRGNPFLLHQL